MIHYEKNSIFYRMYLILHGCLKGSVDSGSQEIAVL